MCGGGVEYLHRDPASRRRRRKGKSEIWDSKIWSRVPREPDQIKTTLARASTTYKRQTKKKDRNCQRVTNICWGSTPRLTDSLTVSRNMTLTYKRLHPCGGGFKYLHRDPASRRRRRKGKSRIWDIKIWSRVPREPDQINTTLARASSTYKRQTKKRP
jgi:transposase